MAKRALAVMLTIGGLMLAGAAPASAEFGLLPGSFYNDPLDDAGQVFTQAGGHPESLVTEFEFTRVDSEVFDPGYPSGSLNVAVVDLPVGLLGNPQAVPQCPRHMVTTSASGTDPHCPAATQVGIARVIAPVLASDARKLEFPIYNIVPERGQAAAFAFSAVGGAAILSATVRTGDDYGVRVTAKGPPSTNPLYSVRTTFWGVPGDPSHDAQRGDNVPGTEAPVYGQPFGFEVKSFLSMPTDCSAPPQVTRVKLNAYDHPEFKEYSYTGSKVTGCEQLSFAPSMSVAGSGVAGEPGGLEIGMAVPQSDDPDGLSTPPLRKAVVTLPEGTVVSPSSADGLGSCSPAEIGLDNDLEPSCPDSSKVGTVKIDTPVLADPLEGSLFVARQNDNPFGSLLAVYLVAKGQGTLVKLPGRIDLDPDTGRIKTTFDNNPQLPFSKLTLKLNGGPRAPLAAPQICGTYDMPYELTAWSGQVVSSAAQMTIDKGCKPLTFDPSFSAGMSDVFAGEFSPFAMRIQRVGVNERELGRIDVKMPKGVLAKLRGVELCTDGQIAAATGRSGVLTQSQPACPAGSQIGTTTVGAGAGPNPVYPRLPGADHTGRVFLTEGYKGGAYGLAVEAPAVAGPFDLGTVIVRSAVHVDPETAELTVNSDQLPRILQGIPLNVRDVRVDIDRKDFTLNPTSCAAKKIVGAIVAQDGTTAAREQRFQVGACKALGFSPKLAMRLTGRKQTRTGGHPALRATVTQGDGQANVSGARVVLPKSIVLDPNNSSDPKLVCDYDKSLKADCPASSVIGKATAKTPLLNKQLSGPVHLVQGIKFGPKGNRIRTYPTLLVKLDGEVAINVRAKTNVTKNNLLETTVPAIPDARVSRFDLQINGGKKGILVVTRTRKAKINLCNNKQTAQVELDGHNGRTADFATQVKTPCAKASKKSKHAKRKPRSRS